MLTPECLHAPEAILTRLYWSSIMSTQCWLSVLTVDGCVWGDVRHVSQVKDTFWLAAGRKKKSGMTRINTIDLTVTLNSCGNIDGNPLRAVGSNWWTLLCYTGFITWIRNRTTSCMQTVKDPPLKNLKSDVFSLTFPAFIPLLLFCLCVCVCRPVAQLAWC